MDSKDSGTPTQSKLAPQLAPQLAPKTSPNPPAEEAPPSYTVTDSTVTPTAQDLNAAFNNLKLSDAPSEVPTTEQCLAHLKLLSAFHTLKEDIGYTDGLFNLWDARCEMAEQRDQALVKMREKRWAIYIARAVERFQDWWIEVLCPMDQAERLQCKSMVDSNSRFREITERGRVIKWTGEMLPPLDVLMVWHAFMLNPRNYLEDCVRFGLINIWATGLPWPAVDAVIDTSFNYEVPEEGKVSFVNKTGHNWSNAEDPSTKTLNCPRCFQTLEIPWTTCGISEKPSVQEITELRGTGYGDRDLSHICHRCGGMVDHGLLRVAKFKKETENLILKDWPLGGTILAPTTGATDAPLNQEWNSHPTTFPNRLVAMQLRSKVLELITPDARGNPNMDDVKALIEKAIQNRAIIKKVNHRSTFESGLLKRPERLAIRKMMSRYWENTSIFALELGGAVIRQSIFVDKMHGIDWLHSPAAQQTMDRLITKYRRFVQLMATYPLHTAVPTLDVDLAWHTHQLSPKSYYDFTMKHCKKYIDHDDKISEDVLETGFEWTSKMYEKHYQAVYSECTSIRSKHISSSGKIFGTSKHEKISNNFYESGKANLCPPSNSAHISSHNAVKVAEDAINLAVYERLRLRRQQDLDTAYDKARRRARARGRDIPPKDQYYYGAWGYPYFMYGPYMSIGMMGGMYYAADPCVMPVGAGMTGSCAAGTCGGGVAAGGCGSPGGCGGGGGGGCGASGGFGGCSGGGGGGCGGGGGGGCGGGGGT
ncbi:uncharacterized protein BP5553_08790 [Venustampulla echinocandica]|uniref:Alpha-ketoglutarate-dependent sulfonate dioxygenase n=1 Tax=Venustampulla echinocandica TaxID=2656787 RepID=A0A370TF97_9HELO|nr:uncharacterized protein BP5553_08790 [Venustampulla echinocandica]RDL33351.1 hypothetical protein BP5553_08790 [Venustampulla echinocandica]